MCDSKLSVNVQSFAGEVALCVSGTVLVTASSGIGLVIDAAFVSDTITEAV